VILSKVRQEPVYLAVKELHEIKGYSISLLCSVAELNRSSYYKWLSRRETKLEIEDRELIGKIRIIEENRDYIYGVRRLTMILNKNSQKKYNHKRIYRLMRIAGIECKIRRKRKSCTKAAPGSQAAENILDRDFSADAPDKKWLTDVTEFKYGMVEKAYLSAILDLGDKRIVSYVIGRFNNNHLVFETFDRAVNENPEAHPLFHSDRGYQYTSPAFRLKLRDAEMTQSMSRVGKCIDNGPMEGFWGIVKSEMYYLNKFNTYEELKRAIDEYICFYNTERLQAGLGDMSPIEYRESLLKAA
jgi:transposase InsO family protein